MSESSADDIQVDFIKELKDYIPSLRDKAGKLIEAGSNDADKDIVELHRLVHTIRGAASLVKLNNLSQVASEFEDVIEEVISEHLIFDDAIYEAINNAIDYFDSYAKEIPFNDCYNQSLKTLVLGELLEVRKNSQNVEGKDFLSHLLGPPEEDVDQCIIDNDSLAVNDEALAFDVFDLETGHLVADDEDLMQSPDIDKTDGEVDASENRTSVQEPAIFSDGAEDYKDVEEFNRLQQELLEGFYQEAEDHFLDLGKALGELEDRIREPVALTEDYKELIRLIRRSVHTIKGAAAVIKLKAIAGWGHEFEDLLDWLYEEANTLTPEVLQVIAQSADMLECHVTSPRTVDPEKIDRLRDKFRQIIDTPEDDVTATGKLFAVPEDPDEAALLAQDANSGDALVENQTVPSRTPLGVERVKTLRVDITKVESLVNLAGELSIVVSAFDQDMEGLGSLIAEIDRARLRLKHTARDLELGYELKAIRQLGSTQSPSQSVSPALGEQAAAFTDFDLLELDRYSELNLIIRSLSETAVDVNTISRQLSDIYGGFDSYLNRLRILLSELHEKSMRMRMTPMSTIVNRMRRTIRETAAQLKKKVQLTIHGENIELDRMVWEKLADPLMHLLRNAVDHGIEPLEARSAAGKPEIGTVHLSAAYQGNQVVIRVKDDGAGLDYEAIRAAVASSHAAKSADAMNVGELTDLLLQSGFSTRKTISEVSGRGVGLDVVRENILGLKGSVRIENSSPGTGTTFRIALPLTMAVMQALLFDVGGQRFATALYDIKEILRVNPAEIKGRNDKTLEIGGRSLPFYRLSDVLADVIPNSPSDMNLQWPLVLIVDTEFWQGAVAIDRMYSQREIVIKNLGAHLRQVKGIAGATVTGDGKVVPILDLGQLLADDSAAYPKLEESKTRIKPQSLEIMVVDDSVSVRTVVSRLMQRQGWHVVTAKDGVEAIERLYNRKPDLIVLDVEMPRMNGYEFMSAIRAQKKFEDTPVIMLTSRASKKHRKKAEDLGVNGFITKPYDDDEFIDLVKRLNNIDGA